MTAAAVAAITRFRSRFYYGWWVVFACASIVFLSAGTFFYGFGLLVAPLTAEFGWSRAAISAAFSLRTEVGGIAAPVVGFAIDRVGVRRLIIGGLFIVATGFFMLSQAQSLTWFYISVVVIAIGMSATGGSSGNVAVALWFRRRRGRAMGFMTLGGGMGGLMTVAFAWLISTFGWRESLIIIGAAQLLVSLPLALTIRNRPEDMGLPVDGIPEDPEEQARQTATGNVPLADWGMTTKEALKSALFWKVAFAFGLGNFATTAIIVHQVPFLTESVGISNTVAATSVTAMTAISIIGRLGLGNAADLAPKRYVMAFALLCIGASLVLFSTVHHLWQLLYVLPLFGIGFGGAIPVRTSLQAEYFGLRSFGAIQGMMLTITTLGSFAGPVLAGYLFDISDSYRLAFVLLAIGPFIGIPLILSSRPSRP